MISLIAALDRNRAIGRGNTLPWRLPDDLKHFRQLTLGKPVIMGRKTFESLGKRPLPDRPNLVISRQLLNVPSPAHCFSSLEAALEAARPLGDEIMIIGGGEIYRQTLPLAQRLYLTRVESCIEDADTWFPEWDDRLWQLEEQYYHPADARHPHAFTFERWSRRQAGGNTAS